VPTLKGDYLLMPLWQTIIGAALLCAVALWACGIATVVPAPEVIPEVYVLGFANSVLGCLATRNASGWRAWVRAVVVAHLYAAYTWLLFPVLLRALGRQLGARRDWARTDRVPLAAGQ
jgi:1,2-diacylglycerol 3-beta-glucosyltransferase